MTTPRPDDLFDLDLDGTAGTGRYIEAEPAHLLVIESDGEGSGHATPAPGEVSLRSQTFGRTVRRRAGLGPARPLVEQLTSRFPRATTMLVDMGSDLLAFTDFP
jgi:uncharacterized protein YndB with AHSA1/START domain